MLLSTEGEGREIGLMDDGDADDDRSMVDEPLDRCFDTSITPGHCWLLFREVCGTPCEVVLANTRFINETDLVRHSTAW